MTHIDGPRSRDERILIAKKALELDRDDPRIPAVMAALDAEPTKPATGSAWLTLVEAAALAKTPPRALREAARRGELPAYKGRPVRFQRADVEAWAASRPVAVRRRASPSADVAAAYDALVSGPR